MVLVFVVVVAAGERTDIFAAVVGVAVVDAAVVDEVAVVVEAAVVGIFFASAVGTVRYYDPQTRIHHWQDRCQQLNQFYGVDSRLTVEENKYYLELFKN